MSKEEDEQKKSFHQVGDPDVAQFVNVLFNVLTCLGRFIRL